MLTSPQFTLLLILLAALVLIFSNRVRSDIVGLSVLLALALTGLVTTDEALAGFSSPAVITLIGLFILSRGLEETGVAQQLARLIRRVGGNSELRLVFLFMTISALLSLAMNNIAAGAVLLPVAVRLAPEAQVSPSRLLIPVAFGTLVGGMATYFTTANIILSDVLIRSGGAGLSMADFLPTGGVIAIGTILAMTFLVRRLIPARASVGQSASSVAEAITSTYQLEERSWELEVLPHAPVAGKTLHESRIGTRFGLAVVATWRNGDTTFNPDPAVRLYNGDHLLVIGRRDRVEQLLEEGFRLSRRAFQNWTDAVAGDFVEVVLPPRSNAIGRSLQDLRFRDRYGLTAIALWRGGRSYRTDVGTMTLDIGDALLMIGTPQRVDQLARDPDFLIATSETANQPRHADRMIAAILITLAAILLSVFDVLPSPIAMLLGAAAMVITGCLDMDAAYRSVEWRVLFLIIGFLPLSTALLSTGITSQVSNLLAGWFGPLGSLGFAGGSFLFAMLVTQLIGGQVAALLVGPVVVALASQSGIDPRAIAVAAAIGCSAAFLTPIAHPVNLLMMGPGGYRPQDFLRFGLPIALLTFALLLIGMMLFWGLRLSL